MNCGLDCDFNCDFNWELFDIVVTLLYVFIMLVFVLLICVDFYDNGDDYNYDYEEDCIWGFLFGLKPFSFIGYFL